MYKDKDKQREAQRDWVRQKRDVKGSTEQGSTALPVQCGVMTNSVDPPPERTAQGNIRSKELIMQDGFGRDIDEDLYWRNTGLSQAAIDRIKEYHRTHPVQWDGTRKKDE